MSSINEAKQNSISHQELLSLVSYDHESGLFFWAKNRTRGVKAGDVASRAATTSGYLCVSIGGKKYLAHRLAWFYANKCWPKACLDHIDRDKTNNRLSNLREATYEQNAQNRSANVCNKSGAKGVVWHKRDARWQAAITVSGKVKHLGLFEKVEDAKDAYMTAAKKYHTHNIGA